MTSWREIHIQAAREAERAHRELDVDTSRRIDPFVALAQSGVIVMRRRLDGLAGIYMPGNADDASPPGVMINAAHPLSKQRFTAAHELAHHRRDRSFTLDADTEWAGRGEHSSSDRERFAEAFAAWYLMPRSLVRAGLSELSLRASDLTPEGAYALSLRLSTSYSATVHHLADMQLITRERANQLLRVFPQAVKQSLGALDVLSDSRKNVWLLRNDRTYPAPLEVQEGDALVLDLDEILSSGYVWQAATAPSGIKFVRDEYRGLNDGEVGGACAHRFVYRAETNGRRSLVFEMRRPWQTDSPAVDNVRVDVEVQPKPASGLIDPSVLYAHAVGRRVVRRPAGPNGADQGSGP